MASSWSPIQLRPSPSAASAALEPPLAASRNIEIARSSSTSQTAAASSNRVFGVVPALKSTSSRSTEGINARMTV
ncbi:hypothetical protein AAY78_09615 [Microbacterium sp. Ag1]|nr:hypothetical protein AAY78_09615 [Microbacterium sp. Ag1]